MTELQSQLEQYRNKLRDMLTASEKELVKNQSPYKEGKTDGLNLALRELDAIFDPPQDTQPAPDNSQQYISSIKACDYVYHQLALHDLLDDKRTHYRAVIALIRKAPHTITNNRKGAGLRYLYLTSEVCSITAEYIDQHMTG